MNAQEFLDIVRGCYGKRTNLMAKECGGTYNVDTQEFIAPPSGFAIGMSKKRCMSREEIEPETVWRRVHDVASNGLTDHVGLWIDEDGDLWIEATVVVQASLKDAMAIGEALKQRYIWSFASRRNIATPSTVAASRRMKGAR